MLASNRPLEYFKYHGLGTSFFTKVQLYLIVLFFLLSLSKEFIKKEILTEA